MALVVASKDSDILTELGFTEREIAYLLFIIWLVQHGRMGS